MIERASEWPAEGVQRARPIRILAVANWDFEASPTPWAAQRIRRLCEAGAQVEVLSVDCIAHRADYLRLARALWRRLRAQPYDLVAPLYGSLLGLVCAVQRSVPCALSFAGSDLNGRTTPGRITLAGIVSQLASQLSAMLACGVSVRNRDMSKALWWPPARRRAIVIPSGVDTERFHPVNRREARRRLGIPEDGARVAFVALQAAERPYKRLPLARAAVARLPGVTFDVLDAVPFDRMPLVYAAADVLLLTSLDEGSPNCVKEALACGVPVVSTPVGDVREVTEGLTNCAVVEPDPQALAGALGAAIVDGRGCPEGPARMREHYSIDRMTQAFMHFYRGLVDAR